jgi:hypothetical protein
MPQLWWVKREGGVVRWGEERSGREGGVVMGGEMRWVEEKARDLRKQKNRSSKQLRVKVFYLRLSHNFLKFSAWENCCKTVKEERIRRSCGTFVPFAIFPFWRSLSFSIFKFEFEFELELEVGVATNSIVLSSPVKKIEIKKLIFVKLWHCKICCK